MAFWKSKLRPEQTSSDETEAVVIGREDVSDFNPGNVLPLPLDTLSQIRAWLSPTEYDNEGSEYHKHLSLHLVGTGKWIFSSPVYQQWHVSHDNGILWIQGL